MSISFVRAQLTCKIKEEQAQTLYVFISKGNNSFLCLTTQRPRFLKNWMKQWEGGGRTPCQPSWPAPQATACLKRGWLDQELDREPRDLAVWVLTKKKLKIIFFIFLFLFLILTFGSTTGSSTSLGISQSGFSRRDEIGRR